LTWKLSFLWSELGASYQSAIVSFAQAISTSIAQLYGIPASRISVRNPYVVGGRRLQANVGVEVNIANTLNDVSLALLHSKVASLNGVVNTNLAALGVTGRIGMISDNYVAPKTPAAPATVPYTGTSTPQVTFTVTPAYAVKAEEVDMQKQGGRAPQLAPAPMIGLGLGFITIGALVVAFVRRPRATGYQPLELTQKKLVDELESRSDLEGAME
jgi:hypothetical protein